MKWKGRENGGFSNNRLPTQAAGNFSFETPPKKSRGKMFYIMLEK
jgi:hypothetical protein